MILFRRVGAAFRRVEDRDWLLLGLETIGVLAGILIAFELTEWGERRAAAARQHELMERLFEESEFAVTGARHLRDSLRELTRREVAFAVSLSNNECPPEEQWSSVGTLAIYPAFDIPRSVYQELMGAGGLSSIDDPGVRRAIARFNAKLDWAQNQNEYFRSVREEAAPSSDTRLEKRYDPSADEPEIVTYDRARLCGDRAFRNRYVDATRNHVVLTGYHEQVTDEAIRMCAVLGEALRRRCSPPGGPLIGQDARLLQKALEEAKNASG